MKTLNTTLSIILASINSVILGLSLTSFIFIKTKAESIFTGNSYISFNNISSIAVSNIFLGGLFFNCFNTIKNEKRLIISSTLSAFIGYLFINLYPNIYVIFFSRIIIGIGCGCTCYVVPQYIYTIAPDSIKALLCSLHPINLNLGILIGQSLIKFDTVDYYAITHSILVLALLLLVFLQIFIVDTKKDDGEIVPISELISVRRSYKSIIIVSLLHMSQHLSGVDYVSIYLPEILKNDYIKIVSVYSITIPSSLISSLLLNKYGRKYLYVISAGLLCMCSVLIMNYKVLGLILFLFSYNVGVSTVPWIIPNECTPPRYISPITRLGIISNWGSAYILLIVFKKAHEILNDCTFLIYSALMFFMVIFTLLYVPETKNNSEFL
ncbi:hypothetical protein NCER_100323 [Vairimorpha ceranae BRL01]|uniref:Major facilitator superfamily (MFS) profile domain-containing protein n=2 Tax=Vairimorpha ceranae TaxID=40302 RepID=C4V7A1_VAIC1|nr:glucose transporter type 3 [Vairimorpha ceranae]EEQ82906.1 hypothetical protein NCER_100323 [Vairimorpha ceranae BRL01]KAF5139914.1 hypothetical protein G9O61_00g019330 [Vairimorpha ceranae]KKO75282.1 glucose transporter type 3 [Vairimorpha ceranae]